MKTDGDAVVVHGLRGRSSNRRIDQQTQQSIWTYSRLADPPALRRIPAGRKLPIFVDNAIHRADLGPTGSNRRSSSAWPATRITVSPPCAPRKSA
jgi:hypothetical protein